MPKCPRCQKEVYFGKGILHPHPFQPLGTPILWVLGTPIAPTPVLQVLGVPPALWLPWVTPKCTRGEELREAQGCSGTSCPLAPEV